jgi:uncharacterized protein (DUF4415 family)
MPKPRKSRNTAKFGFADIEYLMGMTDAEIERTAPPELPFFSDDFWKNAKVVFPSTKEAISFRVDADVLDWFRSAGPRYQTRMNAVLRSYVEQMAPVKRDKRTKRTKLVKRSV